MDSAFVTLLGMLAATCTTVAFVPQVIKTWKARSSRDLSLGMFSVLATGVAFWLIYGLIIDDLPIIAANSVTLVLIITILIMKIRFDRAERKQEILEKIKPQK
ncbi:MAG: SemiSWEET transporter [Balneolales bacterium]|nr:SemiSWEET transporter [Balneolales bacterium]